MLAGVLPPSPAGVLLPAGVLDVVETYLSYVSHTSSTAMLWFGLVFTIWFPMRAADCLMHAVRRAYRLSRPKNQLAYNFKVLLYTVFLLMTIALSLALATVGLAVVIFLNPFGTVEALVMLMGWVLVFDGGSDLWIVFRLSRAVRQAQKNIIESESRELD